jgi:hypothetical protein
MNHAILTFSLTIRAGATLVVVLALIQCGSNQSTTGPSTTPQPPTSITVSFNPTTVVGGNAAEGTVTLSSAAPSAGATVNLSSNNQAATVPATVTIPGAGTNVRFPVSTSQVPTPVPVTITASYSGATGTGSLSVQQIPVCGPFLTALVAMPFVVYGDDGDPQTHFIPSGFFGDSADLTLNAADRSLPHSGATATRIDYRPQGPQRFAGIFWQCGTFGDTQNVGFNLTAARQVQFWARSSTAGAKAEFKVGGITGSFPDSFPSTPTNPVVVDLGQDWRQFTIDLTGRNLTRVVGGFMFVTSTAQSPGGLVLFLDDITWR